MTQVLRLAALSLALSAVTQRSGAQCQLNAHSTHGPADLVGRSVALDGDTLLAGATSDDFFWPSGGAVYSFERIGSFWFQAARLGSDDPEFLDRFGSALALDGELAFVGADGADGTDPDTGAVFVFERIAGEWELVQKLAPSDATPHQRFGGALALDVDRLAVVARGIVAGVPVVGGTGAVTIFERQGALWVQTAMITSLDTPTYSVLRDAVALVGDTLFVGAPHEDSGKGAVHVFVKSGTTWVFSQRLEDPGGTSDDHFGASLAADGERLVIGAPTTIGTSPSGKVFAYERVAGTWALVDTFEPGLLEGHVLLGRQVALEDDRAVLGYASSANGPGVDIYADSPAGWQLVDALNASPGEGSGVFCAALAYDGSRVAVGDTDFSAKFTTGPGCVFVSAESGDCLGPGPEILSVEPASVPSLAPGTEQLVALRGIGMSSVEHVEVDGVSIDDFPPDWTVYADEGRLTFAMPAVATLGSVTISVQGSEEVGTAELEVVPAGSPALELNEGDEPNLLFSNLPFTLTMGGTPGNLVVLTASLDLLPSTLPGLFHLDIGNALSSLVLLGGHTIEPQGWVRTTLVTSGLPFGTPVHFQSLEFDLPTSLPVPDSNVATGSWFF